MFERYSEHARRVIFFARHESSEFGSRTIETQHLLLGLLRVDAGLLQQFLRASMPPETLRNTIAGDFITAEKVPATFDLPMSNECRRILSQAEKEADIPVPQEIGTAHLLLGILHEEGCYAAKLLTSLGFDLKTVRQQALTTSAPPAKPLGALGGELRGKKGILHLRSAFPRTPLPEAGVVPDADTAKRIAEAVWQPRDSAEAADPAKAQNAVLMHGVWIVTGPSVAAFIQKEDGKILRIHKEKPSA